MGVKGRKNKDEKSERCEVGRCDQHNIAFIDWKKWIKTQRKWNGSKEEGTGGLFKRGSGNNMYSRIKMRWSGSRR